MFGGRKLIKRLGSEVGGTLDTGTPLDPSGSVLS